MNLCKYRDIIGKPGTGIHSYRLMDVSVVDVLVTVLGAYLLHLRFFPSRPFWLILLVVFLVGIVAHRLFCVRTTVDKWLFP